MGSLFSFISNPFESWIGYLALLVGSAGIAIIMFTIIIRLVLSPLQITQLRSAKGMQRIQPKIQELRKKHGKDRQKLTEETMKLYKEHKVNPAMGCLPMLLQFPVLIGLFWALNGLGQSPHISIISLVNKAGSSPWLTHFKSCLPHAVINKLATVTPTCWDTINRATVFSSANTTSKIVALLPTHGATWTRVGSSAIANWMKVRLPRGQTGWILDRNYFWLTSKYHANLWGLDKVNHVFNLFHADFLWLSHGLGQPDPLYILPVLAGVTQWIQSRMMMAKSTDPQQSSMNMLMNFTPLIIVIFALRYPSGLSLYWVTSTLIGVLISARITGWGTLPRVDRWLGLGQSTPARAMVSSSSTRARQAKPETNGKLDTDADIVLTNEAEADGNGPAQPNGPSSTRPQQRPTRRRNGRPRGGRRG